MERRWWITPPNDSPGPQQDAGASSYPLDNGVDMRPLTLAAALWHLLIHWTHTPGSDSRHVTCSCGQRWALTASAPRCPVCGTVTIGVCCDIVSTYLSEESDDA